ncbi:hypothetical protein LVJ94_09450 [Pendulispora rubella]|uniref:Uncharacterized protein n=1 Tax=Pendulispora rubella TaxID=2741070 RepID=A0ABZ2L998_9BACT
MFSMRARRWLAIGVLGLAGSIGAFSVGASVAGRLERHMHSVSVAKIPVHDLAVRITRGQK